MRRIAAFLVVGLGFVMACGGHSMKNVGGEASADDGSGDDGDGTGMSGGSGGSGGSIAVGGANATGGASGSVSVGGASACPECPPWEYGLVVEGDGSPIAMDFNGHVVPPLDEIPLCSESPLRGAIGRCGYFTLYACEGARNVPPCFEVIGGSARYLDRDRRIWNGILTSQLLNPSDSGVTSGTLTAELSDGSGSSLVLTVDYDMCSPPVTLAICR